MPDEDLAIEGVSVRFEGLTALDGVSVTVPHGRIVGVIGPNGAGKTTLFNVVCGYVRPQAGTIRWRGEPLRGVRPDRLAALGIARTVQGVRLFPRLTAAENVMVAADRLHRTGFLGAVLGLPRADRAERASRAAATAALARVGVAAFADRRADELAFGVQKRVALARALVAEPDLLLLDEPAGGLGAGDVEELADLIEELGGSMSVMLVEHRMDLVMGICEHVVVLDSGRVIAEGAPADVQTDPRVLEAYLGEEVVDARG